jgi:uncharacterized Zn finger protein
MTAAPRPRRFTVPCTITVRHTDESLEAHVELGEGVLPSLGDRIAVHGERLVVPFGTTIKINRLATVTRANALERLWIRVKSHFELTELYEVSFTPGRI